MAINTSSLKSLIDAFAVLTEKDSISPTTVATIFYKLANLMDSAASLTDVATVSNSLTALSSALKEEAKRAEDAETALSNRITDLAHTHSADRITLTRKDKLLQNAIDEVKALLVQEETRAKEAESSISSSVNAEKTRASSAESTLMKGITNLATQIASQRRTLDAADKNLQQAIDNLSSALSTEVARATKAEGNISSSVSSEVTRAKNAESNLSSAINTAKNEVKTLIQQENSRATKAEGNLASSVKNCSEALSMEVKRATDEEDLLQKAIDLLKNQIASEQTRAKNAETAIVAYLISIMSSQKLSIKTGILVTIDLSIEPSAIWEIIESSPENTSYQGTFEGSSFSLMHTAAENAHVLMWISGAGVNILLLSKEGEEIKGNLSRLTLFN